MKNRIPDEIIKLTKLSLLGIVLQCALLNTLWAANLNAQTIKSVQDVYIDLKVHEISIEGQFSALLSAKRTFLFPIVRKI